MSLFRAQSIKAYPRVGHCKKCPLGLNSYSCADICSLWRIRRWFKRHYGSEFSCLTAGSCETSSTKWYVSHKTKRCVIWVHLKFVSWVRVEPMKRGTNQTSSSERRIERVGRSKLVQINLKGLRYCCFRSILWWSRNVVPLTIHKMLL